jgi:hypothetical protein
MQIQKTTRNTPNMGARVLRAFRRMERRQQRPRGAFGRYASVYVDGQWWIEDTEIGITYRVQDARGYSREIVDGFRFEACD